MKKINTNKKSLKKVLLNYGFHIWFVLFLVNIVIFYTTQYHARGQTCFTKAQIEADSRCLYVLSDKVYSKGSRSSPHHGHPCGTDVTSIIPSFHTDSPASYLDPNYVGDICPAPSNTPVPSDTPVPTVEPTIDITTVPSPACLGTTCVTEAPTQEPTIDPNLTPTDAVTGTPGGKPGTKGGFLAYILALILALFQFLMALLGKH